MTLADAGSIMATRQSEKRSTIGQISGSNTTRRHTVNSYDFDTDELKHAEIQLNTQRLYNI